MSADTLMAVSTSSAAAPGTPKPEESENVEMSQNGGGPPSRVRLTDKQLETLSKDELIANWRDQDTYLDIVESQSGELAILKETLERTRQQLAESQHREKVLVRRLASKEQEMQDYASQLAELRAAQVPSAAALRSALLDPAASLLVQKLRQELAATKTRLEETQNELSAWKFTPDSNTGKRLMAKCRLLYQENEELGRVISSGRLAKLEGELALQKNFSDEVKKSQSELDEFLQELDEDVEGMQGTIYFLQQQLKASKEALANLTQENNALRQSSGILQQVEEGDDTKGDESRGGEEDAGSSWAGEEEDEITRDSAGVEEPPLEQTTEPGEEEFTAENTTTVEKANSADASHSQTEEVDGSESPPAKKARVESPTEEESEDNQ